MSETTKLATAYDYELIEVLLSIDRMSDDDSPILIDITTLTVQLDIYEDINRPFLIGELLINSDNEALMSDINFVGTEKINIKLHIPTIDSSEPTVINKNFIITGIMVEKKTSDNSGIIGLEMIEDFAYRNYLENVNKAFNGTGTQIIEDCIDEFLGKTLDIIDDGESSTPPFKIIVPNWHPFEVITWIRNLMVKDLGFPYYFYSTIHSDDIMRNNLLSMLEKPSLNQATPFIYSASAASNRCNDINNQSFIINSLDLKSHLSTLDKAREGNVGSSSQQIDLIKNSSSREIAHFSALDMFKHAKEAGGFKAFQSHMSYDSKVKVNGKKLHEYDSRRISQLQISNIYSNSLNSTDVVSLNEVITAKAINSWMQSSKITINVPGRNFIGDSNRDPIKLGDTIFVSVLENNNQTTKTIKYNEKQSGEYIIQSLRHHFVLQRYSVVADCVKFTDKINSNEKLV